MIYCVESPHRPGLSRPTIKEGIMETLIQVEREMYVLGTLTSATCKAAQNAGFTNAEIMDAMSRGYARFRMRTA